MKKSSKKPEIRRKELVDIALKLFSEKGYDAGSVRDILAEVHGVPDMFYYYFKSKQDIYLAAIEQYLTERIDIRRQMLDGDVLSFEEKQAVFRRLVEEDLIGYCQRFRQPEGRSITDDVYKLWDFMQMLNRMIGPLRPGHPPGFSGGKAVRTQRPHGGERRSLRHLRALRRVGHVLQRAVRPGRTPV